jgi:hypothetical protein
VLETSKLESIHSGSRHKLYRSRGAAGAIILKVTAAKHPEANAIASPPNRPDAPAAQLIPGPIYILSARRELKIPDKIYGRDREITTLTGAFSRALQGGRELVVVTGEPGIGKSALVNCLARPVTQHHGLYVAGKFDQLQRSLPFSALAQAFRALLRHILTGPEPALRKWRERIEAAVAPSRIQKSLPSGLHQLFARVRPTAASADAFPSRFDYRAPSAA